MNFLDASLFFLTPFPDGESVNSLLQRLPFFAGSKSLTQVSKTLLRRKVPTLDDMPCDLAAFHREIGHLYCSFPELVAHHTSYDMDCCGLPRVAFEQQLAKLAGRSYGPIRLCKLPLFFCRTRGATGNAQNVLVNSVKSMASHIFIVASAFRT